MRSPVHNDKTYLSIVSFLFYHGKPRRARRREIASHIGRRKSDTDTTLTGSG
jgi:hypothetical protein